MHKRIHYISSFAGQMSDNEIEVLASQAAKKNAEHDITGVLMAKGGVFFQIIEGPEENIRKFVEWCYEGPPYAVVTNIIHTPQEFSNEFNSFNIVF